MISHSLFPLVFFCGSGPADIPALPVGAGLSELHRNTDLQPPVESFQQRQGTQAREELAY